VVSGALSWRNGTGSAQLFSIVIVTISAGANIAGMIVAISFSGANM
jgi:hypothetical protein